MAKNASRYRSSLATVILGATVVFGSVSAAALMAPAAYAQAKPKAVKLDPAVGKPLAEAQTLAASGEYTAALQKADAAGAAAKTAVEKYNVDLMRRFIYGKTKNYTKLAEVIPRMIASGQMPAGEIQSSEKLVIQCLDQSGQQSKAAQAAKDYVNKYGHDKDFTIFVASRALAAKDYKTAIDWTNRAIEGERKAGRTAPEKWYQVAIKSSFESKDMAGYYAGIERVVAVYPKDDYWRLLTDRASKEAKFSQANFELDQFRLLSAAGVKMKPNEKILMAEAAISRKLSAEALAILQPMKDNGELAADAAKAARNQRLLDTAKTEAAADAAGLASLAAAAAKKPNGIGLVNTAELYLVTGNNKKAIELYTAGLAKGGLDSVQTNAANLRLGIAQFRDGQGAAARKTWGAITGNDGAAALARTWTVLSSR
jgi:hypothetical protein